MRAILLLAASIGLTGCAGHNPAATQAAIQSMANSLEVPGPARRRETTCRTRSDGFGGAITVCD
jgi:hypothetical protein